MDLLALIKLMKSNPDKASDIVLNLEKNGYYTDFNEFIYLSNIINDNQITKIQLDLIIKEILKNEKSDKELINYSKKIISERSKSIIDQLYDRTDKSIPRKSFEGYLYLIFDKSPEELKEYEDMAFTYEGYKMESPEERIYDSLNGILNYLHDELGQEAAYTPEQLSFFQATREEIVSLLEMGDIPAAKMKLVALQLHMDIGTKFRTELKEFLLVPINLKDYLDLDKGMDMGRSK